MCPFADLRGGEDDVVVVEVEAEGNVEFFADGEQIVDGPGNVVVLEDQAAFDGWGEGGVVCAETVECCGFVTEGSAHVEDHYCVSVFLRGKPEEGEQFVVVFEIPDGVGDHCGAGRAELCELSWMCAHSVSKLSGYLACLGQCFTCKWREFIAVFCVTGEREHFRT